MKLGVETQQEWRKQLLGINSNKSQCNRLYYHKCCDRKTDACFTCWHQSFYDLAHIHRKRKEFWIESNNGPVDQHPKT